jgi:DNA polymerase zeta
MKVRFQTEMLSWGYMVERGYKLDINLRNELSRIKIPSTLNPENQNQFGTYELKFIGRVLLNVWRLMRSEVSIQNFTTKISLLLSNKNH